MNLRMGNGRVPVRGTDPDRPILLVDFPDRDTFDALYSRHVDAFSRDRYWTVLNARRDGATLAEAGGLVGITRERVRQIEAKFMRLLGRWHHDKETS